ncbi:MAG: glycosyltransferase family 4 protein [Methanotrichaceae archaeon]|nr:glycosyltransferase family 4 protein [Methanotrichaceae archaeon]
MKIAFIYYDFSSFVRQDYEILSRHFDVEKVNYRKPLDVLRIAGSIWRSDVSFTWFASGHSFLSVLLSKMMGKKSIVIAGGYDVAFAPEISYGQYTLGWHKRKYADFALKNTDLVLAVSEFTKAEVIARAKPKKIKVIYNAIDIYKFRPANRKEEVTREDLVLTVASGLKNVIKLKGLDIFVKAAAHLPEAKFLVLGLSNDDKEALEGMQSSNNVEFRGYINQDELILCYQKAKIYCQLSYRESFGVALAEAMACGCMPVVTDRGALPEVVGDVGFYVPYGDLESTVFAIKNALKTNNGNRAGARIEERFSQRMRESRLLYAIKKL